MPTILITGANRGLGLEWVRQLEPEGWRILATFRDPARSTELLEIADRTKGQVSAHRLDVNDFENIDALANELSAIPIDALINNAGVLPARTWFGETDYDEWMRSMRNNLFSYMKMCEAFVDHVGRSDQKLMMCMTSGLSSMSVSGSRGGSGQRHGDGKHIYRTTKVAVNMLVVSLADYLADRAITVVSVTPGWASTEMGLADLDPGYKAEDLVDPVDSVRGMRALMERLTLDDSGGLFRWDGSTLPW